jgi:REP element-mobilizing transposase RayT
MSEPLAYFISFRTYGTWLHGDERGSVDRDTNQFNTPFVEPNEAKRSSEQERMSGPPIQLTPAQREVVANTITEVAHHRHWLIHTLNVRTNHVHIIVSAPNTTPEKVMNDLKAYATRRLREANLLPADTKLWSRHGSTPHLYDHPALLSAIHYVANLQ